MDTRRYFKTCREGKVNTYPNKAAATTATKQNIHNKNTMTMSELAPKLAIKYAPQKQLE